MSRLWMVVAGSVLLAACSGGEEKPPAKPIKEEMTTTVKTASDLIFAVQSEVDPAMEPEAPAPDTRWAEAEKAAQTLKAVATSLQEPGRAKDDGDWMKYAREFAQLSDKLIAQAKMKNGAQFSTAANALLDNRSACHKKYQPQPPV